MMQTVSLPGIRLSSLCIFILFVTVSAGTEPLSGDTLPRTEQALHDYADPVHDWGAGMEAIIETAYRRCFKTYILDGRVITVRIPFAQNDERSELAETSLPVQGHGKADPDLLWEKIDALLDTDEFQTYAALLSDGREKVVTLDMAARKWTWTSTLYEIASMKAGSFRGLPHRPSVLVNGNGLTESDIYNYLYAVGRVGMDCSGFVWHILSAVAADTGIDIETRIRQSLLIPSKADLSLYMGTRFFDSAHPELIELSGRIDELNPADILLFRGEQGYAVHSALIQSIDHTKGIIRYLQSTDEAPPDQRGVHDSCIYFDPSRPELTLKDSTLVWTQQRYPPFPGEEASPFSNDGERFRAYPEHGGGKIVRLRALHNLQPTQ